jgi:uncharacterized integral membrane protein
VRYLSWIVTIPITLIAVLFAVSNRATVAFAVWPLPFSLELPLYLAVLGVLVLGFVAGGVVVWLGQHRYRRDARRSAARVAALERDLDEANTRLRAAEERASARPAPPAGEAAPVSPARSLPVLP